MSDKRFDKILQDKLKGHQISFDGSRWEDMEKALIEADDNSLVDTEVRNRLKNHAVPYQESHWQILKSKLELEKKLKEKIYLSKVAEAAILILIIVSIVHLNPQKRFTKKQTAQKFVSAIPTDNTDVHSFEQSNTLPEKATSLSHNTLSEATTNSQIREAASFQVMYQNATSEDGNSNHQSFGEFYDNQISNTPHNTKPSEQSINSANESVDAADNRIQASANLLQGQATAQQTQRQPIASAVLATKSLDAAAMRSTKAQLVMNDENRSITEPEFIAKHISAEALGIEHLQPMFDIALASRFNTTEKWLGVMTGVDMNIIRTPIDANFFKVPRNYSVIGVNTGANYSVQTGRNELSAGISYSIKEYDPNIVEQVKVSSSYYSRDYTLERYNIVHVPFQYKRHLGDNHKVHAYVFGGVSANFVLYTDFEQQDNLKRGQPRSKQNVDFKATFKDAGLNGLLEGGFYKNNIYFSADIGTGLEKQINRIKLFVESQYKRNLFASHLGPRKVKLNSLSFNVGAKYRI